MNKILMTKTGKWKSYFEFNKIKHRISHKNESF